MLEHPPITKIFPLVNISIRRVRILIKDTQERGWKKEITGHQNIAQRVRQIIQALGSDSLPKE